MGMSLAQFMGMDLLETSSRSDGRKYKVVKDRESGQYAAKFEDDSSLFFLNAYTRKEAIEEAEDCDHDGLFNKEAA